MEKFSLLDFRCQTCKEKTSTVDPYFFRKTDSLRFTLHAICNECNTKKWTFISLDIIENKELKSILVNLKRNTEYPNNINVKSMMSCQPNFIKKEVYDEKDINKMIEVITGKGYKVIKDSEKKPKTEEEKLKKYTDYLFSKNYQISI